MGLTPGIYLSQTPSVAPVLQASLPSPLPRPEAPHYPEAPACPADAQMC